MDRIELQNRMTELEKQISMLPPGGITKKTIKGKDYFYHRWTENKRRREKYIPMEAVDVFRAQIERRKALEQELNALKAQLPRKTGYDDLLERSTRSAQFLMEPRFPQPSFSVNVLAGEALASFSEAVCNYKKRACFQQLHDYIYGEAQDKVLILYGLRRTGKTTMIRQIFAEMSEEERARSAFIQITTRDSLAVVNRDLNTLRAQGFRNVFLDEVTLMEDFVEGAALFSDVFAACGMKIVLSGTDSLGFLFTEDEQLYDRCIMIHTTFIPYREFESVLGIHGIDEYIRYGGTMSLSGVHYNEHSTFASKESADEYVDTAIARNIQHSLHCYQYEGHFRHLRDLYDRNELTSAINRVVEDINHRFTLEVLTREWKSHDLGISAGNLRRDREHPSDILDRVDLLMVTERLRELLEIRNKNEQTVKLDDIHGTEIKEYLELLDLTQDIDVRHMPDVRTQGSRTVIAQPGLRYAQAGALIRSLLVDERFSALSLVERNAVQERILTEIRGRMLEDIVLLETQLAHPKKQVFVLQFPVGEFDMVVFDTEAACCQIFEIKHSEEMVPQQYRHLINEEKCAQTEHRYGPITGKFVLYRGTNQCVGEVQYRNVEDYLREMKEVNG